jgi:hypothetical protein
MIPHEMNPMGLEEYTTVFHIFKDGSEISTEETTNNYLYCYAIFPDYGVIDGDTHPGEWCTVSGLTTQAQWDSVARYVTKNDTGAGCFMLEDMSHVQHFYRYVFSKITITFDTRIYDTYWRVRNINYCKTLPTREYTAGSTFGALPTHEDLKPDGQSLWPTVYMDDDSGENNYIIQHHTSTLLGWFPSRDVEGETPITSGAYVPSKDTTYYAKWKWTVRWDANNAILGYETGQFHCYFGLIPWGAKYKLKMNNMRVNWDDINAHGGYDFGITPAYTNTFYSGGWKTYGETAHTTCVLNSVTSSNSSAPADRFQYRNTIDSIKIHCPHGSGDTYVSAEWTITIQNFLPGIKNAFNIWLYVR